MVKGPAGRILRPQDLKIGDKVQCLDGGVHWYEATVQGKAGVGKDSSITVRYAGYPESHNKTFVNADKSVRSPLARDALKAERREAMFPGRTNRLNRDSTYIIDKLIAKRKRAGLWQYRVRWQGWDEDKYDTWETVVPSICKHEFDVSQALATQRARPTKQPPTPYAPALCANETDEVRLRLRPPIASRPPVAAPKCSRVLPRAAPPPASQVSEVRIKDVETDVRAHMRAVVAVHTSRQKLPVAESKVYVLKPFSAANFVAYRELLYRRAKAAQPNEDSDLAVTPIASLRRGARPIDIFSVMRDETINELLGDGVFVYHANTTGAAVKLVAPLDFMLRAKRVNGVLHEVKELVVKAHYVILVPNHGAPGAPIFRVDFAAFLYPANDIAAYKKALAAAIRARLAPHVAPTNELRVWAEGVLA